jgi:hypothetical protein
MPVRQSVRRPLHRDPGPAACARHPGPRGLAALQAMAADSAPVRALRALGAGVMQRVADVHDPRAFNNPLEHFNESDKIVEDGGSAGMSSDIYRDGAARLADEGTRDAVGERWGKLFDRLSRSDDPEKKKRAHEIGKVLPELYKITDFRSAGLFLRQNSLAMAKGGIDIRAVRRPGDGEAPKSHTFHRDTGFVRLGDDDFGPRGRQKVAALNGPKGQGWVQGHSSIRNYKHRFVEHLHVDKGTSEAFEIYNAAKEDVEKAEAWGSDREQHLTPEGRENATVDGAETARRDADLDEAERQNGG